MVPLVTIPGGRWQCSELRDKVGPCGVGCVVAEGMIAHDLVAGGRVAKHLVGPGDVLAPSDQVGHYLPLLRLFGVTDRAAGRAADRRAALASRRPLGAR